MVVKTLYRWREFCTLARGDRSHGDGARAAPGQVGTRGGDRQLHARVRHADCRGHVATHHPLPEEGAVVENSLLFQGVTVGEGAQLQGIAGHRFQLANDLF